MKTELFLNRHVGPNAFEVKEMLKYIGVDSLKTLIDETIPENIRLKKGIDLEAEMSEADYLMHLKNISSKNKVFKTYIGLGYNRSYMPAVIQRNILENPGWYTAYTPYQAEIAQGRLEALLNFQTMISDLTGLEIANASLLDEGLAAAEAVNMCIDVRKGRNTLLIHENVLPQTISIVQTRMEPLGVNVHVISDVETALKKNICAILFQNPGTNGQISDLSIISEKIHKTGAKVIIATDLLACTIIKSPGEMKADIVIGTNQRFGIPMGFGGPHAGFLACKNQFKRKMPGRLVGVSITTKGTKAYRFAPVL
jgi:glycine dehydrogenase